MKRGQTFLALVLQVLNASVMAWAIALVTAPVLMWTLGVGFLQALGRTCLIVAVFLFGAGAASIGGGVVWVRPLGAAHLSWKPTSRDDVPELDAPFTLLGVALFVVPQLLVGGVYFYS